MVLPRIHNTIRYIDSELDEMDREEIFRIKKVCMQRQIAGWKAQNKKGCSQTQPPSALPTQVLEVKRRHEAAEEVERTAFNAERDADAAEAASRAVGSGAGGGAGAGALASATQPGAQAA